MTVALNQSSSASSSSPIYTSGMKSLTPGEPPYRRHPSKRGVQTSACGDISSPLPGCHSLTLHLLPLPALCFPRGRILTYGSLACLGPNPCAIERYTIFCALAPQSTSTLSPANSL